MRTSDNKINPTVKEGGRGYNNDNNNNKKKKKKKEVFFQMAYVTLCGFQ